MVKFLRNLAIHSILNENTYTNSVSNFMKKMLIVFFLSISVFGMEETKKDLKKLDLKRYEILPNGQETQLIYEPINRYLMLLNINFDGIGPNLNITMGRSPTICLSTLYKQVNPIGYSKIAENLFLCASLCTVNKKNDTLHVSSIYLSKIPSGMSGGGVYQLPGGAVFKEVKFYQNKKEQRIFLKALFKDSKDFFNLNAECSIVTDVEKANLKEPFLNNIQITPLKK